MAEKNYKRYTVTAALPYANGPLHIGHLAGVYVPADIYVRYLRSKGEDVAFISGSDEHGVPITIKARKEGKTPQQIVDEFHEINKKSFEELGISFDIYSRTSNPIHHKTSSAYFKKLFDEGKFVERENEQYYDKENQQFLADRYITGTCPHCGYEKAYGDQCENCGTSLSPNELINPTSAISGNKPVLRKTKHWYLPLDQYEPWLKQWILEEHKKDWKPNVYGQCKSWLDKGLQARAVTRDLNWGVKVPLEEAEGKVLYVWFDAPIGYISATKEWAKDKDKDWELYWKNDETKLVHFIGKDNIVFHCIVFPSMLKAEGSYILPDNVPSNEFLNLENDKISTSRGWAVWLNQYLESFPGKQDELRYVLCANAPENKDNNFTWKDYQDKNNNELIAILGNFVNRTLVLTQKYFNGEVPDPGAVNQEDRAVIDEMKDYPGKIARSLENYRFREALTEMMNLARLGNKYLTDNEPWKKIKTDEKRVKTILNISLQIAANLSIVSEPFIPFSAAKISEMLNISQKFWNEAGSSQLLEAAHQLNKPEFLFSKIEDETVEHEKQKMLEEYAKIVQQESKAAPAKDTISFDDFTKLDIRSAKILEAEKVPKTKKLIKMIVDTGVDKRTIVSGIAEYFNPEDVIGKQVSVLINLEPRKIKGIESKGMILMAEDNDGSLHFVKPEDAITNGSQVK